MLINRPGRPTTREEWLGLITERLWALVEEASGIQLPSKLRVVSDDVARYGPYAGLCVPPAYTQDGIIVLYVSPTEKGVNDVAGTMLHELIHAVLRGEDGHGPRFQKIAAKVGFQKPVRPRTIATPRLRSLLKLLSSSIGPCPDPPRPLAMPTQIPRSFDYPRMLFHRTLPPVTVSSPEEENALGTEWNRVIWPASGSTPEPVDWLKAWHDALQRRLGFPRAYYHRDTRDIRLVNSKEEAECLGELWYPSS